LGMGLKAQYFCYINCRRKLTLYWQLIKMYQHFILYIKKVEWYGEKYYYNWFMVANSFFS
jgi:hypothetical protein